MQKIDIKDIVPAKANPRAEDMPDAINAPIPDIDVEQTLNGFKVINGHMRLKVQLDIHGSAVVRVIGTGEQFTVRRAADGTIVRA